MSMHKRSPRKEPNLTSAEKDLLVETLVGGVEGSHYLGKDAKHPSLHLGEYYDQKKYSFVKNYARKIKRGVYDKQKAVKGVNNNLITPVARQIQSLCKKHDVYDEPLYCNIPKSVREKASVALTESIEMDARNMLKEQPEEIKIKRSRPVRW